MDRSRRRALSGDGNFLPPYPIIPPHTSGSVISSMVHPNPLDYASGSFITSAPNHQHAMAPCLVTTVVLDSAIPLPSDRHSSSQDYGVDDCTLTHGAYDPSMAETSIRVIQPSASSQVKQFSTHSHLTAQHTKTLPTHSRGPPLRSPSRTSHYPSHQHTRTYSNLLPTSPSTLPSSIAHHHHHSHSSGRSSPVVPADYLSRGSSGDVSIHPSPAGTPPLKPLKIPVTPSTPNLSLIYQMPPTAVTTTSMRETLLHSDAASSMNPFMRFFRTIFILFCCFMTPSHYDHLKRQSSTSLASSTSPYLTYAHNNSVRRQVARDRHRHRHRQSAMFATASSSSSASSSAGVSVGGATPAISRIRAASEATLPPPSFNRRGYTDTLSASDDDDSDCETDASHSSSSTHRRLGPCCERPCFPSQWDRCCSKWYRDCCTVRRSICIFIYLFLIAFGVTFLLYYHFIVRRDGWKWPIQRAETENFQSTTIEA